MGCTSSEGLVNTEVSGNITTSLVSVVFVQEAKACDMGAQQWLGDITIP